MVGVVMGIGKGIKLTSSKTENVGRSFQYPHLATNFATTNRFSQLLNFPPSKRLTFSLSQNIYEALREGDRQCEGLSARAKGRVHARQHFGPETRNIRTYCDGGKQCARGDAKSG